MLPKEVWCQCCCKDRKFSFQIWYVIPNNMQYSVLESVLFIMLPSNWLPQFVLNRLYWTDCVLKKVHTVDIFDVLDTYSSLSESITVLANLPNPVVIPYTTVGKKPILLEPLPVNFLWHCCGSVYQFITIKNVHKY